MADGMVRINCDGLLAVAIKDPNGMPEVVDRVSLIFLDPEKTIPNLPVPPEAHRPRLEVEDANVIDWARTSLSPEPRVTPLTFSLTGWQVSVRPNDLPPAGKVRLPQGADRPDPHAAGTLRMLSSHQRLLDLKSICGVGNLNSDFLRMNPPHPQVVGFLTLESGVAHTMSTDGGGFDVWAFNGVSFNQEAADALALFVEAKEFVTLRLTKLTDPTIVETITVKCQGQVSTVNLRHTCRSTESCKRHKGDHVAQYYEMANPIPGLKPTPIPPLSESSYCPPARLSEV